MNYLLDTCVLSEYKKPEPSAKVLSWLDKQADESLYISVLTIGEMDKGIYKMPPSMRKTNLATFVETLIARFDRRILDLDTDALRRWGPMIANLESKGRPIPVIDSLMAATALVRDLTLVTRNTTDFESTGVKIFDPWSSKISVEQKGTMCKLCGRNGPGKRPYQKLTHDPDRRPQTRGEVERQRNGSCRITPS